MTSPVSSRRYETLDGLRGVAALAVMLFHYTVYDGSPLFFNVDLAVDFFFMLSGFVLCHAYGARLQQGMTYGTYVLRRVIRLQPLLVLGLLLGTPVLYILIHHQLASGDHAFVLGSFVHNMVFLPFFNDQSIFNMGETTPTIGIAFPSNPPLWSLCFEMFVGLMLPFFLRLKPGALFRFILIVFFALIVRGVIDSAQHDRLAIDLSGGWGTYNFLGGVLRVLYGFTAGVWMYAVFQKTSPYVARLSFLMKPWVLYLVLLLMLAFPMTVRGIYTSLGLFVVSPILLCLGAHTVCHGNFSRKMAGFLGWLSYPLYCLHYPVGRAVFFWGEAAGIDRITSTLIAVSLALFLAIIVTRLLEEPVRRRLSHQLLTK
ncbi:MAG: acyltransferase family protein [Bdellovibrionales bacterium]